MNLLGSWLTRGQYTSVFTRGRWQWPVTRVVCVWYSHPTFSIPRWALPLPHFHTCACVVRCGSQLASQQASCFLKLGSCLDQPYWHMCRSALRWWHSARNTCKLQCRGTRNNFKLQCLRKTFETSSCPWSSRLSRLCLADTLRRRVQAVVVAQWVALVSLAANAILTVLLHYTSEEIDGYALPVQVHSYCAFLRSFRGFGWCVYLSFQGCCHFFLHVNFFVIHCWACLSVACNLFLGADVALMVCNHAKVFALSW